MAISKEIWLKSESKNLKLVKQKVQNIATMKRISKHVAWKPKDSNDQWYFDTFADLEHVIPVWQAWWYATVLNVPTWPAVFYQRDVISWSWLYSWPVGSYIWLSDTDDVSYTWKAWYTPTVNSTETWLELRVNSSTDEFVKVWSTGTADFLNSSEFQQDNTDHITVKSIAGTKVSYDNTVSGMVATETQWAIDELFSKIEWQDTLQEVTDKGNTTDNDIEITDATKWIILTAPDSTRRRMTIDNTGNPVFTSL